MNPDPKHCLLIQCFIIVKKYLATAFFLKRIKSRIRISATKKKFGTARIRLPSSGITGPTWKCSAGSPLSTSRPRTSAVSRGISDGLRVLLPMVLLVSPVAELPAAGRNTLAERGTLPATLDRKKKKIMFNF